MYIQFSVYSFNRECFYAEIGSKQHSLSAISIETIACHLIFEVVNQKYLF